MTAASIAHLRITLDDIEPAVVRRVEVPLTIGHFDPTDVNVETLAPAVHSLAKKWSRRPSADKCT